MLACLCTGTAHTFFVGANDKPRAGELINVLREAQQPVPEELLKFGTTGKPGSTAAAEGSARVQQGFMHAHTCAVWMSE